MASTGGSSGAEPVKEIWDGRLGVGFYQIVQPTLHSVSVLDSFVDASSTLFPSLQAKNKSKVVKVEPVNTPTDGLQYFPPGLLPQGSGEMTKRPVGRPRIHPIKYRDPNRIKRVAKGDKPLGRPRTSHLKPPKVKRPIGRPRKDASKEINLTPMDELLRTALTEDWRSTFDNNSTTVPTILPKNVSDSSLSERKKSKKKDTSV